MKKVILFHKLAGRWFADVGDVTTQPDVMVLEMVAGADIMVELMPCSDELKQHGVRRLSMSTDGSSLDYNAKLVLLNYDDMGAYYECRMYEGRELIKTMTIWLCPVTLFVFGEYPECIWVHSW